MCTTEELIHTLKRASKLNIKSLKTRAFSNAHIQGWSSTSCSASMA